MGMTRRQQKATTTTKKKNPTKKKTKTSSTKKKTSKKVLDNLAKGRAKLARMRKAGTVKVGRKKKKKATASTSSSSRATAPKKVRNQKALTAWSKFIKGKMSPYMKSEGSHKAAMRRLSKEWKAKKKKG